MKVSILISTYNGKEDIGALLDSIRKMDTDNHEVEVILRDDNSRDGTVDEVSQKYPWVTLIRGDRNLGFVDSNNVLFPQASGEVICCLNQDVIVSEKFLLEGLAALQGSPEITGVNTNMIMPWVMPIEEYLKTPSEDLPAYEYQLTPYGFTRYVEVQPQIRETNFLTGGAFFLRRSALETGEELFDSNLHMYCEDNDLSMRLTDNGGVLVYAPKTVLYHNQAEKKASSLNELKKLFKITWNRFYVMAKHNPPLSFIGRYPTYLGGIIRKMDYLGLPKAKLFPAYIAAGILMLPFLLFFPYWLLRSIVFSCNHKD